ncbi:hypothetical protein [Sphaerothrix gracilis]|uniref:hypothetical protein n=1 Tax=Sphaerothrix gracilis TaxID=3151835 RepID=UPI0031FC6947
MLKDNEFNQLAANLQSEDLALRVSALKELAQNPTGDKRVLPILESLLQDKTPCLVMLPYRFGEVRWIAAHALAAEYAVLDLDKKVRLEGVVRPINTQEFATLEKAANLKSAGGVNGVLAAFATLRELGHLPTYELEI